MNRSDSIVDINSDREPFISNGKAATPKMKTKQRLKKSTVDALNKCKRYFSRLIRSNQMDFEFAIWQMIYLFINPKKVYRNFQYRKHTKNQFARDDPAFLVLLSLWFIVSASGLSVVLHLHLIGFAKFLLWMVFIDCIFVGVIVATGFWFVTNRYFKKAGSKEEDVEWGYAFDVHLNAFFPPLLILHVFQLFFYNFFISSDYFFARFFGNSLWLIAVVYYCYITFLGYSTLNILHGTQMILYPLVPLSLFYLIATVSGYNICRSIMDFYHYRVY